ncbi:MAG: hypothetical protein IS860_05015 [Nitrosopumilus sp.]|uniref:Uncharacterized protein n=1 Tax=Nitrosopumilus piranensis TaxID=1582439 RepID=A0A0C5BS72_9ARCH|nr:hypothetical protein [Nitrosopumilus piranensis]AJM92593.1 exported protein of unknown function [Nitrosopumilus piranensis]MBI1662841.1 hypothetical protein [Nitrosopumilus sp.]MCE2506117.1 hypothetical protein [Nitrosopumilaceae archaeon]
MKHVIIFVIVSILLIPGIISIVEAHPHATVELTDSHSHILADEKFHDDFWIHTFDQVIFSMTDFFNSLFR